MIAIIEGNARCRHLKNLLMSVNLSEAQNTIPLHFTHCIPSNRVFSSLEGKFGTVDGTFVLVIDDLFMKISNICKNSL
jgi:hypothetical protein